LAIADGGQAACVDFSRLLGLLDLQQHDSVWSPARLGLEQRRHTDRGLPFQWQQPGGEQRWPGVRPQSNVGYSSGTNNSVLITGPGSIWSNANDLFGRRQSG